MKQLMSGFLHTQYTGAFSSPPAPTSASENSLSCEGEGAAIGGCGAGGGGGPKGGFMWGRGSRPALTIFARFPIPGSSAPDRKWAWR